MQWGETAEILRYLRAELASVHNGSLIVMWREQSISLARARDDWRIAWWADV